MSTLALDLASTNTGVCRDGTTRTISVKGPLLGRARRIRAAVISELATPPDRIVIEAIGTRHVQTAIAIATVHALVLDALPDGTPLHVIAPAQLKRWATGKGNADKTALVTSAMRNGWNAPDNCTDDQADAWWLWTIGEALAGVWRVPETTYRTDLLKDLT